MDKTVLKLDLGSKYREGRQYARDNPDVTLREFLRVYPARFREPPTDATLELPMSTFTLQPVELQEGEGQAVDVAEPADDLRAELDAAWEAEQAREPACALRDRAPDAYPTEISDNAAVHTAYHQELEAIADFLAHDLSVLVSCDKMLTEFVYEHVCDRAGREVVLDTQEPDQPTSGRGLGGRLDQALGGGQGNPLAHLPLLIRNLKPRQVLVLRSLDLLDNPPLIEQLYQRTNKGRKPQFLAFLDPSLEVKKVLTDRFAVHVAIMGLSRYISLDGQHREYTVNHLLTREERLRFCDYDPEGLYKNVSGLNAIQFRNAMQYVGTTVEPGCATREIYRVIRQFKTSSSSEIEIPDTDFGDIGGYESVKQELQRTIDLIAGPIEGMAEEERMRLIPRGFVFHGPPGTGKTLFAKAIANEMNATIQMISGPEIMDKYVGQSENNLRRIFATARRNAPSVVFFDEFDSLASQRSTYADGGARANNAVVAQFLTELDGFRPDQAVLVIGTTNRIDIIDEALLRPSRLRPVEIGLPDYSARQRVAEIHAARFGVDTLLKNLCRLATEHLAAWEANDGVEIPEAFLEALFGTHPLYKTRYEMEEQRAGFLRELQDFFAFVHQNQDAAGVETQTALLDQMSERLIKVGRRYGLDLDAEELPDLAEEEAEAWLLPMQSDLRDLFTMLLQERRRERGGLTPETFFAAVMDLVAEYTVSFNNDEIRAIFQEASLEHYMEGQLVTPRYIGQKIGLIRKRRDEREATHLSEERGR
jgi:SpoVK/Ycf46/Vps4 family AAA+-type ATPase